MPTTGESEEVNEEEIILELERENKRREDCSYQNAPHFSKTENEWRRFRVDWKWNRNILEGIGYMLYRHEKLQLIYLRLGYNENKKAIVEEAEGLEKEVNNKNILEKKKKKERKGN